MLRTIRNMCLYLAAAALAAAPARADRTVVRPAWNLFSPQQDMEMGRILSGELERTFQVLQTHDAAAYIDALGHQLASHAPGQQFPYQFKIVQDDSANAWAMPGGFIYVTTGMIEAAQNEPQLAGVVAHEIAHAALRHGTAEISQAYADRVPGAQRQVSVNEAMRALNIQFQPDAVPLNYSPEQERQATVVATQIMRDSGFNPLTMPSFFSTLENGYSGAASDFFQRHPYLSNPNAIVRSELQSMGGMPRQVRGDSPDFHTIKNRLLSREKSTRTGPFYEPDNGYQPGYGYETGSANAPAYPSTNMVRYRGRDIEFLYPQNWRVVEQTDSTLSIAPAGGFVSGSLAYGMSIGLFQPQGNGYFGPNSFITPGNQSYGSQSLSDATNQLINHLQQANPSMRVIRRNERRRVGGADALVVEMTNPSPAGGAETDWVVSVLRPNGLVRYFVGVAPQQDFSEYQPAFDRIVSSVRFLD